MAGPSGPAFLYNFYPRSPCGERLFLLRKITITVDISIHALLAESDRSLRQLQSALCHFYPRSPCGERRQVCIYMVYYTCISIHALLAESDVKNALRQIVNRCISIHALLAESDYILCAVSVQIGGFLSTLSLRRATYLVRGQRPNWRISIHALLAESDTQWEGMKSLSEVISIHALLAESDIEHLLTI